MNKRFMLAGLGACALAVGTVTPALAQGDYGTTTTNIALSADCGEATITWHNGTPDTFVRDYRIGDETGIPPVDADLPEGTISEGPLAGDTFGPYYHPAPISAGESATQVVTVEPGEGTVPVKAWIKVGPEQRAYSTASVEITRCAPQETTPPSEQPPEEPGDAGGQQPSSDVDCADVTYQEAQNILSQDPSDPNRLDRDGDGEACESQAPSGSTGADDGQTGDEATDAGLAPTPTPQPGHIAVTG